MSPSRTYTVANTAQAKRDLARLHQGMKAWNECFAPDWYKQVRADIAELPKHIDTCRSVHGSKLLRRDIRYALLGKKGKTRLRAYLEVVGSRIIVLRVQPSRERHIELERLVRQERARRVSM